MAKVADGEIWHSIVVVVAGRTADTSLFNVESRSASDILVVSCSQISQERRKSSSSAWQKYVGKSIAVIVEDADTRPQICCCACACACCIHVFNGKTSFATGFHESHRD